MMIRQDYKSSNENRIALYCQFLESNGHEYEYISFILDDTKIVDYYFLDDDTSDQTYNIYFDDLELGKNYNIKVVGKLKSRNMFEVASLWCYCIEPIISDCENGFVFESEKPNIAPPDNIILPILKVVN